MMEYTLAQVMTLARRVNNPKRAYLIVNPLQAKHVPVRPDAALDMMRALGVEVAKVAPNARLVIGFAETATAVGAAVAGCMADDCVYMHTTREEVPGTHEWICFREEHSHAVEQRLCADRLGEWIEKTEQLVFVDDELTTGKTLINIVDQLRDAYPALAGRRIIAASILNRLSPEHEARLRNAGIQSVSLVRGASDDLTAAVEGRAAVQAQPLPEAVGERAPDTYAAESPCPDPRLGVRIGAYHRALNTLADETARALADRLPKGGRLLALGTEECMMPALMIGEAIERATGAEVRVHATTRSPIGVCPDADYPIRSGVRLRSFYDPARTTYLYNLDAYDAAVVFTDARGGAAEGRADLTRALRACGCGDVIVACGG